MLSVCKMRHIEARNTAFYQTKHGCFACEKQRFTAFQWRLQHAKEDRSLLRPAQNTDYQAYTEKAKKCEFFILKRNSGRKIAKSEINMLTQELLH